MQRRQFLLPAGTLALTSLVGSHARADTFPSRPIRIILGYPPGGTIDGILRTMAIQAGKYLGQSIVIENKPGAGSVISLLATKNAAADGYTLSISATSAFSTPIQVDTGYEPLRDSTYIARLTNLTFGVVVRQDSPFKTWDALLKYIKANPGKASYGVPAGPGNTGHLAMIEVAQSEKLDLTMVPYKGSADLQQALLGGQLTFATDASGGFTPMLDGKERLLALLTERRVPLWPAVPTLKELGYPVSFDAPWGLVGPPNMDPAVVDKLADAFHRALNDPEVRSKIIAAGQNFFYLGPRKYTEYANAENDRQWSLLKKYDLARKR